MLPRPLPVNLHLPADLRVDVDVQLASDGEAHDHDVGEFFGESVRLIPCFTQLGAFSAYIQSALVSAFGILIECVLRIFCAKLGVALLLLVAIFPQPVRDRIIVNLVADGVK